MNYFVTRSLAIILAILGISILFILFNLTYQEFISTFTDYIGIAKEESLKKFVSEKSFKLFRLIGFIFILSGVLIYIFANQISLFSKTIYHKITEIYEEVKSLERKYLLVLLCLIVFTFLFRLYLAISFPISYDEAWTFFSFTQKGFLVSVSFYPVPNNHIFHTLLTSLTYHLPFGITFNLRLPVLFFGTFSIAIFFFVLRKFFGNYISIGLTTVFSLLLPTMLYGYQARGYTLVIFFFIISFYGTLKILEEKQLNKTSIYWFYLSFGAVLGMYSIPTFIYPYFSLISFLACTFLFHRNLKQLVRLFISGLVTGLSTIILYSPIFIISGLSFLSVGPLSGRIPRVDLLSDLFSYFQQVFEFLLFSPWSLVLIILLSFILLTRKRISIRNKLAVYIIFLSPVLLLIQGLMPPIRTWMYLVIPILFLLGSFFKDVLVIKKNVVVTSLVILSSILVGLDSFNSIRNVDKQSFEGKELSSFLIDQESESIFFDLRMPTALIMQNVVYLFKEQNFKVSLFSPNDYDCTGSDAPCKNILLKDLEQKTESTIYLILDKELEDSRSYEFIKKICEEVNAEHLAEYEWEYAFNKSCSQIGSDIYIHKQIGDKLN